MMIMFRSNNNHNHGAAASRRRVTAVPLVLLSLLPLLFDNNGAVVQAFVVPTSVPSRPATATKSSSLQAFAAIDQIAQLQSTYTYCLETFYVPTQMATFGAFSATGDAIAQKVATVSTSEDQDEDDSSYDPTRTFHYLLKGLGGGIMWSYWYSIADPISMEALQAVTGGANIPEAFQDPARIMTSITLEQMVACPIAYALWDIPVPALLRGTPLDKVPDQIRHKLAPLLLANAKVWTLVNVVTYSLPSQYRLLFCAVMEVLWQSVNSKITSKSAVVDDGPTSESETTSL